MNSANPPTPLTDRALARLRALATGNGLDPEKIVLTANDEKTYVFEGTTTLTPLFEAKEESYDGAPRDKDTHLLSDVAALRADAKKRESDFRNRPDWIEAVSIELHKEPGQGWGLDGARIELPHRSITIAATETCKTCQGRKNIPCTKCYGRGYETCMTCQGVRQEFCWNCNYSNSGSGPGSSQIAPGQFCRICNGLRHIPCRSCRATGQTGCPVCQARGSTPCTACKGMGKSTREIKITCGATTHFVFKSEALPSSLRRGLDRLGIVNLSKGHADIIFAEPKESEHEMDENDKKIPGGLIGTPPQWASDEILSADDLDEDKGYTPAGPKAAEPKLKYTARMPFADLRVDFGGRKAAIGVFGLRSVLLDVPPFLDVPLEPWLEKLQQATKGRGAVSEALEARALHEALELNLDGKGNSKEFRRLYPFGISNEVAEKILRGTRLSIKRMTLRTRAIAAVAIAALSAGLFAGCFFSSLPARLMQYPKWGEWALDLAPLVLAEGLGWVLLSFAATFDLHRHFPNAKKIGLLQATGKTGTGMLVAIAAIWLGVLAFSPARPYWLPPMVH